MQLPGHTLVMSERPSEIRVHCPGPVSSPCKHLGDLCALPQSAAPVTAQRPGCSSWTTMATSPVRHFLVSFVMPKKCYEEIFVHLHMHGEASSLSRIDQILRKTHFQMCRR